MYASSPSSGLGELGYLSAQHRSKYLWWTGRSTQGFGTLGLNKRTIGHTWLVNPFLARSILKGTGNPNMHRTQGDRMWSSQETWGPTGWWTKTKIPIRLENMMGFWWDFDMLNTDCIETRQDLSPWASGASKCPGSFGGGSSEKSLCWTQTCPLLRQEQLQLATASLRDTSLYTNLHHATSLLLRLGSKV